MRIYVAGAYSADNVIAVLDNIRRGIAYCARLCSGIEGGERIEMMAGLLEANHDPQ